MTRAELTEHNRAIVEAFTDVIYRHQDVVRAFSEFVSGDYIQHNPTMRDGREAAIEVLLPMFSRPGAGFEIKRILVDGDLAMVHVHGRSSTAALGGAVADIYRLRDGKLVEHWDVVQPIPDDAVTPHPMF